MTVVRMYDRLKPERPGHGQPEHPKKVIEELTDPTKTILKECYYENKKYQEVADEFGISTNGVTKHIMKALRLIREEFGIKKKSREVPENEVKTYIPYKE